jgi:DNA-binding LacI/PurR family transcriptional regulator
VSLDQDQEKKRRATLVDVAKLAKVSTSAVSRTFTPGASVSKKTRTRVLKAAEKLGFRPNILARSLMTGRSALIAVVSNAFGNPYIMQIVDTFTLELQHRGLRPLVFNLSSTYDWSETVALMSQYQIDGIAIASSTLSPTFVESVLESGIPTVMAFGRAVGDRRQCRICRQHGRGTNRRQGVPAARLSTPRIHWGSPAGDYHAGPIDRLS